MMYQGIKDKKTKICVVGLGYVGLPIALEFAKKFSVIGFDINQQRVDLMRNHQDPSKELTTAEFDGADIYFTANPEEIKEAKFYIVAVPTPIDDHKNPDLQPLLSACKTVGKVLKKGDYVIFESTVYPGCTEEDCVPVLERCSGLRFPDDFKVGYSPERINPGDKVHTLTKITKVVGACDAESLKEISAVYAEIIEAGMHEASSIKVAEAAKIIENTQRDVNISLMNELSIIFNRMNINTYEVLEAAGTKWNFLKFSPGLVGGHCIGVDPYYLVHKATELGYHSKVIASGRSVNDSMGALIAKNIIQHFIKADIQLKQARVLVMGTTFKENVSDIRNSKVVDVVKELESYFVKVDVTDPYAGADEVKHEYGLQLTKDIDKSYDAIVLAVNHQQYMAHDENYFLSITNRGALFYDVKGVFRGKIKHLVYKSL